MGCRLPSGAIEEQNGVGALCDMPRNFVEAELHRLGVGVGQAERQANAALRGRHRRTTIGKPKESRGGRSTMRFVELKIQD